MSHPLIVRSLTGVLAALLLACLVSLMAPVHLWGLNYAAYLPGAPWIAGGLILLGLAGALLLQRRDTAAHSSHLRLSLGLALACGALFYLLPIRTELYGDSRRIQYLVAEEPVFFEEYYAGRFLLPDVLSMQNGESFTFSLAVSLHAWTGMDTVAAFRHISCLSGVLFVFLWMQFIQRRMRSRAGRWLAAILVLTGGMMQVFYCHVEVYAVPMVVFSALLIQSLRLLERPDRRNWLLLGILLYLAIRTHSAGYIFLPWLGWLLVTLRERRYAAQGRRPRWEYGVHVVLAGVICLGTAGYFLFFQGGVEQERVAISLRNPFLPLLPAGNLDNAYAMLSPWHIWDYAQEMLLCSAPAVGLVLVFLLLRVWKRDKAGVELSAAGLALGLMSLFLFAVDPKMTFARDWDLMGLMAPALLLCGVLLLARYEAWLRAGKAVIPLILCLCALQAAAPVLNAWPRPVHARLHDLGIHAFRTLKAGASFLIRNTGTPWFTPQEAYERAQRAVQYCQPFAVPGQDMEYAFLLSYLAAMQQGRGEARAAIATYERAAEYSPTDVLVQDNLCILLYNTGQHHRAGWQVMQAMAAGSRNPQIWAIGMLVALEQDDAGRALLLGRSYREQFGDPLQMGYILTALERGEKPASILARVAVQ